MKKRDYKERLEWKEGFKDVKQKRRKLELSSESEFNAQKHWRQICRINFRSETLSVSDIPRYVAELIRSFLLSFGLHQLRRLSSFLISQSIRLRGLFQ